MLTTLSRFKAVTPHDTNPVVADDASGNKSYSRAIYIGVAGDVTAIGRDGTAVLFKAMPVGLYNIEVRIIKSTATTATNIIFLN